MRVADMTPEQYEAARARYARYRETDKYKAVQARHAARRRDVAREHRRRISRERPEVIRAQGAVANALRAGRLERPADCQSCGESKRLDAHHHIGYDKAHELDVQWLCRRCHKAVHNPRSREVTA